MKEKLKTALGLYAYFFRIGWFIFGGGWNIVAQIQKDFVEKQNKLTGQELLDIVSVGRSMPGTMIGNVAYLFGYHQCGAAGGVLAVLGIITPPMIILSVVTVFYRAVRDNPYVARVLNGVRAAVCPIILAAVLKLQKTSSPLPRPVFWAVVGAACVASFAFDISSVLIVAAGVLMGLIYHLMKRRAGT